MNSDILYIYLKDSIPVWSNVALKSRPSVSIPETARISTLNGRISFIYCEAKQQTYFGKLQFIYYIHIANSREGIKI